MADPVATVATTPAADGFTADTPKGGELGTGNAAPKAPLAKEPEKALTAEQQAAADKAADKAVADKAAADAETEKAKQPDPNAPLDHSVWGDAGTENGNAVLTVLQNSGVSTEDAKALLFDAMVAGDVTKIDRAALEAKVGKVNATIIMTGVTNEIKDRANTANAIVSQLHGEVGGKENWDTVAAWAKANVPEEELSELRGMIDAGGRQAKAAARELKELYEKADGNSSLQHKETLPGNNPPTPTSEPLSGPQYVRKLEALNKQHFGNPPEHLRRALLAARQQGRKNGL